MEMHASRVRFPLMGLGMFALLMALWAGLLRLGWALPLAPARLSTIHGPLMVCGFLGTLIGVERAVALGGRWPYTAPLLTGVGAVALFAGQPAAALMTLGSLGLVGIFAVIVAQQPVLATLTMACGALLWLVGNSLWLGGQPWFHIVPWWIGFLLLTIAGERLELSRLLRLGRGSRLAFLAALVLCLAGLILAHVMFAVGMRLLGAGMVALALWLCRYDIARRTVRQAGVTRFIAVSLLSGYGWLGVSGVLGMLYGGVRAGPLYDAMLHTFFLGFVFAMIFGHAPVIFPAVLGRAIPYHVSLYAPLCLLHASLLLRVLGDVLGWWPGRMWGGLLNAAALLLFLANLGRLVQQGKRQAHRLSHDRTA